MANYWLLLGLQRQLRNLEVLKRRELALGTGRQESDFYNIIKAIPHLQLSNAAFGNNSVKSNTVGLVYNCHFSLLIGQLCLGAGDPIVELNEVNYEQKPTFWEIYSHYIILLLYPLEKVVNPAVGVALFSKLYTANKL